jgi:crotonobetainyl-CoA:carnitine CoA-transferase CaiB-like acyl-CoA transferase
MSLSPGALAGVRVLDLTRYIPGPYCAMLLGAFGADVVKVEEPPWGDPTRAVPPLEGEDSAAHAALNRNKRSIAIDIRKEEGARVIKRLAETADVLVEANRPGVLARRGLGAEALLAQNPRLVYCSLTGFGQDGPLARRPGHDINYAALGGFLGANRDPGGRPVLPAAQVADVAGGLFATIGILAALNARERTGRGQVVDASMYDAVLALMTVPAARTLAGAPAASELSGTHACYNVYRCRDGGYLAVGALEPKFWEALCAALELPEYAARQWERGEKRRQGIEAFAGRFAERDRDEWYARLREAEVCVEPVLDLAEVLAVEEARDRIRSAAPVRLSETPLRATRPAPSLGEGGDDVLGEAGYARAEIDSMRTSGVIQ